MVIFSARQMGDTRLGMSGIESKEAFSRKHSRWQEAYMLSSLVAEIRRCAAFGNRRASGRDDFMKTIRIELVALVETED
ncbi:hypothetical protein R1flu_003493 [Riccia fluitans]|uniref:Uncharacterized protein n=1 Tax=Riccia fluitans TaxID=41844 RepID=A0ABD1Y973_9MARC